MLNKISLLFLIALQANAANVSLVVALKPDKNPEAMISEKKDLEAYLEKKVGMKVKVIVPLTGAVIQEGLANGTIDLAYVSGMEMVKMQKEKTADLLLVTQINGKNSR